jgi:hypothetical protein
MSTDKWVKRIIASPKYWIVAVVLATSVAVTIAALTPIVDGYEQTFRGSYSILFWVVFSFAVVGSISLLILSDIVEELHWGTGYGLLTVVYGLLFALPYSHGYALVGSSSADVLYHLGVIRSLAETGVIEQVDWYPMNHILGVNLLKIGGLPLRAIQPVMAYIMFILFILFTAVFIRRLAMPNSYTVFGSGLAASSPLLLGMLHTGIHPAILGFYLLPMVLTMELVHTDSQSRLSGLGLVVVIVSGVFWHPVSGGLIFVFLSILGIMGRGKKLFDISSIMTRLVAPGGIILVVYTAWYTQFESFEYALLTAFGPGTGTTSSSSGGGILQQYLTGLANTDISIWTLLWEFIIMRYGVFLLYGGAAGLIIVVTWSAVLRNKKIRELSRSDWSFHWFYVTGTAVAALFLLIGIVVANPIRASRYVAFASIGVIGLVLPRLLGRDRLEAVRVSPRGRQTAALALIMVILMGGVVGAVAVYQEDKQLSQTTVNGVAWQLDHQSEGKNTRSMINSNKVVHYILGTRESRKTTPIFSKGMHSTQAPAHLGYNKHTSISNLYNESGYLVTRERDRQWHKKLSNERRQGKLYYTNADAQKLKSDDSALRVYSNGRFEVHYVVT